MATGVEMDEAEHLCQLVRVQFVQAVPPKNAAHFLGPDDAALPLSCGCVTRKRLYRLSDLFEHPREKRKASGVKGRTWSLLLLGGDTTLLPHATHVWTICHVT